MKKILFFVAIVFCAYILLVFMQGCAQIIPPTGGPRDSLPPVMLSATPKDSTLHFKGNKIVLTFDEYIQLERPEEQLVVSPVPKVSPVVEAKLKEVTIRIKDTLEDNTTYSINFGRSLKDLNEGNPYKNFTYLFSTGDYLDSSILSGKVIVAETGKPDSTLIVMLHRNFDDSAVMKERPRYFARLDSSGQFRFSNIAPGRYNIFALKDVGGQKMYMRNSDVFAFYVTAMYSLFTIVSSLSGKIISILYYMLLRKCQRKKNPGPVLPLQEEKALLPKKKKSLVIPQTLNPASRICFQTLS